MDTIFPLHRHLTTDKVSVYP